MAIDYFTGSLQCLCSPSTSEEEKSGQEELLQLRRCKFISYLIHWYFDMIMLQQEQKLT